jgi:hypothetical protein
MVNKTRKKRKKESDKVEVKQRANERKKAISKYFLNFKYSISKKKMHTNFNKECIYSPIHGRTKINVARSSVAST